MDNLSKLYKEWKLITAPLDFPQNLVNELRLNLTEGLATISTNNYSRDYIIDKLDDKSGIIILKCELYDNCQNVDDKEYILTLISKPFQYSLKDEILIIKYKDQDFHFI